MSDSQQERNNMASEHDDLSSLDLNHLTVFCGTGFLQVGDDRWPLSIPHNGADPPTPSSTTAKTESPFEAKPWGSPRVIDFDHEEHLKAVGSPQIQKAAAKRRKKDATYQCPFDAGAAACNATFTTRHNLRYHMNAHLGLKPYGCGKCSYAAASPATKKRHQATCKGMAKERNDMVPKQDYPPSQKLADINLADRYHFSFGENEISHHGDDLLWPFLTIPANRAAGLPRLPLIAALSPQSFTGPSPAKPPVINIGAVTDVILAAELSRVQQMADQRWKKERTASG